jgi:hypothetical protein
MWGSSFWPVLCIDYVQGQDAAIFAGRQMDGPLTVLALMKLKYSEDDPI